MTYIGIDPGLGGAVSLKTGKTVTIHDTPTFKKKDGKKDYDLLAMSAILAPLRGLKAVCYLELVHSMTGQGVSSSFNFGRGRGLWEGIIVAHGIKLVMVTPQAWKKEWPELSPPKVKAIKGSAPLSANEKKEADRDKRLFKANAKAKARELAGIMYPQLADRFKTVNSDGRAEAALIATYAERHFKE